MVKNKKNHTQIYVRLSFQCIFYCEREWQEVDDIISHMRSARSLISHDHWKFVTFILSYLVFQSPLIQHVVFVVPLLHNHKQHHASQKEHLFYIRK
jgi:hypothetical protein